MNFTIKLYSLDDSNIDILQNICESVICFLLIYYFVLWIWSKWPVRSYASGALIVNIAVQYLLKCKDANILIYEFMFCVGYTLMFGGDR